MKNNDSDYEKFLEQILNIKNTEGFDEFYKEILSMVKGEIPGDLYENISKCPDSFMKWFAGRVFLEQQVHNENLRQQEQSNFENFYENFSGESISFDLSKIRHSEN